MTDGKTAPARAREIRVMLYPRDFERAKRFYRETLRWEATLEGDGLVLFEAGGAALELLSPQVAGRSPLPVQGCGLSVRVADVWALWGTLQGAAPVVFPLRRNPWGDDSFCIADPEGFELTFFTDRPPGG